jgi:ribosomal protein S18 acetylase RimI-like enzyme
MKMLGIEISTRFISNKDFDRIIEIDYTSSGQYGWKPDDLFQEWKKGVGIVAVDLDDFPLGFCIYGLEEKPFFEIKHLVADRSFQRSGIATTLINRMKNKLNDFRNILSCSVPEENLNFQLFMRKMEFKAKLIRRSSGDVFRFEYEKIL